MPTGHPHGDVGWRFSYEAGAQERGRSWKYNMSLQHIENVESQETRRGHLGSERREEGQGQSPEHSNTQRLRRGAGVSKES